MSKKIKPIDANFDDLAKATMDYKNVDDAVEKFAQVTQNEMATQAAQPNDMLKSIKEGDIRHVPFRNKEIRSVFMDNAWWFSVIDVIEAVAENQSRPGKYWADLKRKLEKEGYSELPDKIGRLKMKAADGKLRETDCIDTETLFRLIQSIPSPKAEPFRRWLAKVGYERILEEQDPEIAIKRALATYKSKGYSDEWINARLQTIASRKELTAEWNRRGINEGFEYALLTDTISDETFDVKTSAHKDLKGLSKHHNLRDHMSSLELALTMLGETTTAELAKSQDAPALIFTAYLWKFQSHSDGVFIHFQNRLAFADFLRVHLAKCHELAKGFGAVPTPFSLGKHFFLLVGQRLLLCV